jgi:hypothetical protein
MCRQRSAYDARKSALNASSATGPSVPEPKARTAVPVPLVRIHLWNTGPPDQRYARPGDVSGEREVDGRLAVKLQADAWEVNVRASSDDFMKLTEIRSTDWSQRRSIAAGEAAGAPVFWASVNDHAALMVGHDDEAWDISITLPFDLVDEIVREVAAQN